MMPAVPETNAQLQTVALFVSMLAVAGPAALVAERLRIPSSVVLLLVGIALAVAFPALRVAPSPDLLLAVLIPGLLFEGGYRLELDHLRRLFGGVLLLAIPGVLVSALVVAAVVSLATGMPFALAFLFGIVVSPTDPAAVLAAFRDAGHRSPLRTLVEAESMFNDGTSLVLFAAILRARGEAAGIVDAAVAVVVTLVVSGAIGAAVAWLASRIIALTEDIPLQLTVALAMAYGAYLIAVLAGQSGIIAAVAAALTLGALVRTSGMSARAEAQFDSVLEFVAFVLNALVFLLLGFAIASQFPPPGAALLAILVALLGRAATVYGVFAPVSRVYTVMRGTRGLPGHWLNVLFWSGLRGAVAVAMALSLPDDLPDRALLQGMTYVIVAFTVLVQGSTARLLLERDVAAATTDVVSSA